MRGFIFTDAERPVLLEWLAAISVLIVMVGGLFVGAKNEKTLGGIVFTSEIVPKNSVNEADGKKPAQNNNG